MSVQQALISQYRAALEMLRQAIERCPADMWDDAADKNRFWHVAYHALFYAHFYLQDRSDAFVPWEKHRDEQKFLGMLPRPPHRKARSGEPYSRDELLEYWMVCDEQVGERVLALDLEAESGFWWLEFGKLELQLYNIRHIMVHTGELMERLGARAAVDVEWVGDKGLAS